MKHFNPQNIENIFSLTPLQEGILFHHLSSSQKELYFEQLTLEISGEIDSEIFKKTWHILIKTNEMLRAVFRWEKIEKPSQIILKESDLNLKFYDLSNHNQEKEATLAEIKANDRDEGFDLNLVPFRIILCKLDYQRYQMVISNHHILYDGWSNGIILKEFFNTYNALLKKEIFPTQPHKPSFKEYIKWLQNQDKTKQKRYWESCLEGLESGWGLPVSKKNVGIQLEEYSLILAEDIKHNLYSFIKENHLSLATVFYTTWGILLQRYSNSEDVSFGTTVSGRPADIKGIEDMIGLFINTIPLRFRTFGSEKIKAALSRINDALLERKEFECTPLSDIQTYNAAAGPLFNTIIAVENYPLDNRLIPENSPLKINSYSMAEMTHYDIAIGIMPFDEIEIKFSFNRELFDSYTIANLALHFKRIIEMIITHPETALSQLEIITNDEKNRLLYEFNDTAAEYPRDKTIHGLFAEQAAQTPDAIALVARETVTEKQEEKKRRNVGADLCVCPVSLTYRQLNEQSDQLAGLLMEKGVLPDNIVAIMMERSIEMIIGILGILKSGNAYLPIDPGYPQERIDYMLKDSNAAILLTDNCQLSIVNCQLSMNKTQSFFYHPNQLAYVIYTSGSTGKPKGVIVRHTSVVNLLYALQKQYPMTPNDSYLFKTSYLFDVSVTELFAWFMGGGKLTVLEKDGERDPNIILKWIEKNQITHINFVPSMFNLFLEHITIENKNRLSSVKYIMLAGEALSPVLVKKFNELQTGITLENIYGPTEATVYSCKYSLSGWNGIGNIPIGKPLANTKLYILNKYHYLQPVGIAGELCISGPGLARGYLNNPELTIEKFYRSYKSYETSIFYKTGDLARWLPAGPPAGGASGGVIEFLGRIDHQVKIRGFRIELGEIEQQLLKHALVQAAVVIATAGDMPQLNAYIVLKNDTQEKMHDAAQFKEYLASQLPNYMIPSHFFIVEKIPLTPNGKVDNKALLAINNPLSSGAEYVSPQNDIENTIANIWKELLNLEKVSIHDNFFDLGGNSLLMISLNSRLKSALPDKKEISVVTLFNHPTIASLANYLNSEEPDISPKTKNHLENDSKTAIAVIGMAGRFPGAKNIDQFWENIKNGSESIHFFTNEELKELGVSDELINNPDYVPAKGVLENKEYFDSFFFGYTPSEADILDPQVRIFHECAWAALENAGYDPFGYQGAIGLYAGASPNPVWEISPFASGSTGSYSETWNALQFSDKDYLSTRIAYKLDLKGPCLTIQTACSTSLVAVDQACRALESGACSMAMAGGVSITFQDEGGYLYQEGTIMSPDGHCRAFDARAKGTVGGNGVGIVVLKPLADAQNDGDNIYAVIKGFGINNDGRNKVGFTAPSSTGQARAIRDAMAVAKINPETITYIEAHGTGTPLGDPIEIEGLKLAFNSPKKHFCALGSVKTNIGHLDAAAGIAGLIKTTLSLYHGFIPPSLNFQSPNPQCDLENSPFYVNTELKHWKNENHPLRAGVSSFGLGGTNVHIILEEYTKQQLEMRLSTKENPMAVQEGGGAAPLRHMVILLSAQTPTALETMSQKLANYFEQNSDINLTDAAYTLQVGRKAFPHRKMLVCSDIKDAISKLPDAETALAKEEKHTVIFMFSGQGSQYVNMGLDLYQNIPTFQHHIDQCFSILKNITGIDMKPILYPEKGNIKEAEEKIFQFKYTTPIKFSFEYALAKTLISWGITPGAMIGHSFGEYVAACLSGVFSLEDGLFMAALRGELMHSLPDGAMLSVPLSEKELKQRLTNESEIDIAAINAESLCIVSGPIEAINRFETKLNAEGHECLRLQVPKAGHSRMVEPIMAEFKQKISKVKFNKPQIPFISCVTGTWMKAEDAVNPGYWTQHLRKPVRFADGLTHLFNEPNPIFLQTTPGKGLILFINQHPDHKPDTLTLSMVRHHKEPGSDVHHTYNQIGRLWLKGLAIQWDTFYLDQKPHRIPLPAYPFESQQYPIPKNLLTIDNHEKKSAEKFKLIRNADMANWFYIPVWEELPQLSLLNQVSEAVTWLVFIDDSGIGKRIIDKLHEINTDIIIVSMGDSFTRKNENAYIIDPRQANQYERLFHELHQAAKVPRKIIHSWSVTQNKKSCRGLEELEQALELGFFSLLNIARAIGETNIPGEIHINVITNNMQSVTGEEEIFPEKACLRGAVKIIPLEYDNISCSLVDFFRPNSIDELAAQLLREFLAVPPNDSTSIIALRGRRRWTERMKPLNLEKFEPGPRPFNQRLKKKGVYLITGGFGGMGFTIAEYLALHFQAKIILVVRSNAKEKIQKIRQWESAGAEIIIQHADISDLERMKTVIREVHDRFGPINGVFHTAGLGDYAGLIRDRTRQMTKDVMAPKVNGTWVLEKVLEKNPLDFLVLFSSIGNIIYRVKFAQVGYNAANEYLEAFAQYKTQKDGTYTVTINWCDWLEVGMSIEATNQKYQKRWEYKMSGKIQGIDYNDAIHGGITPAQGVAVLNRIVNNPFGLERVTVSMYELEGMLQILKNLGEKNSTLFADIEKPVDQGKKHPRPPLSIPYTAPSNALENGLAATWSDYFGITPIGIEDDFFELGGDSLKAMLVIQKIHKELGVRIPLAEFFKNPTVKGQAGYIARSEKKTYHSIPLAEKKEYYPQSSAQRRIYIIQQMEANSIRYNITHAVILTGELEKKKFQDIFAILIRRHDSLRTSFRMIHDEAVQTVHEKAAFELEYKELADGNIHEFIHDFIRAFDLSQTPLLRARLIQIEEKKHLLLIGLHHIIADGASIDILQDEIISLYSGKGLPPLSVDYKDYAEWQNREKNSKRIHEQGKYWQEVFAGEIPFLNLPTDYKRPILQSFAGSRVTFEIGIEMTAKLKALALETGATMYMVILAVYTIFLANISNQDDIVIGTPASGRGHTDLEKIIGMFVNTLTLRNYPSGEKPFLDYLWEIKHRTLKAFENQDYQYEDLVERVVKNRDISRNPLFDIMFVMQQNPKRNSAGIHGLIIEPYEYEDYTSKFDLTLEAKEAGEKLWFCFEYSTKLFKHETIERFIAYFINIIKGVIENSRERISEFEIITEAEKNRILFDFNDTGTDYPKDKTIHQLFAEQVEQTPDRIAVFGHGQTRTYTDKNYVGADLRVCPSRNACNVNLTYRQLNEQSNHLAGLLIEKGISPDDIIGIMVERSVEMIIGIMGILKSGGAYLPIDPHYPRERIDYMLKDSNAVILLTDNCQLSMSERPRSGLEARPRRGLQHSAFELPRILHSNHLCYVIYTSGSTGKPKGVMIDHASVVNLLFVMQDNYPFAASDTYLLKTSYVFDVSVTELFGWFMGGGRVAVLEKDGHKDPRAIVDSIERNKVSFINFVPSMFNSFIEYMAGEKKRRLAGLKHIFLAGEELLPGLVEKFRDLNTGITLENIYGPTENTVYSCKYSLSGWDGIGNIPIGKPLANTKLYILNKYHYLQPVGIAGELCISGPGLARGYLNNPELTAQKFIDFHHSALIIQHSNLYCTGDLGRWLPDGNIEFLGRIDHQVKVRGFRIELGEIENRLLNYPGIKEAVVLARGEESGDKYLCAYFVSDKELERAELVEHMAMVLPEYMIPAYFTPIERIPLTPSGKIDRRALPEPGLRAGENYTAPRNEIERKLVGIWSEVLGRDALQVSQLQTSIGINDNFFQLGGHSLKATFLVTKIHKVFNVKIPLVEIFKNPTVSGLSNYIRNTAAEEYTVIAPVEQKEYYVLSSAERRLHFLQEMDKDGTAYNIPAAWILEGLLDRKKLAATFVQLIKRHESFRTSFVIIGEEPVRRVHNKSFAELFQKRPLGEDPLKFIQPFDLSQAPLLRVGLVTLAEDRHMLLVDMHHIISDGMSTQVLARDFSALYAGNELPGIKLQYKDYAEWQNRERVSKNILEQGEFWEKEFEGEIPVLELPADYARPAVHSFEGHKITFEINRETTGILKTLALETGTTLYMLLLALYTIFLSKLSNREDIVVGTLVAGRRHDDLEKIIGMFVNTLAPRNYPAGEKMFRDFLAEVKEKTLKAFENQEYPYEDLVEKVTAIRDVSRNPLFDTMFVLQNTGSQEIAIPGLKLIPYELENKTSKFALSLTAVEVEEKLRLTFEYSTKLFKGETIERFIDYFMNIIRGLVSNSRQRIADFEIITEEEKNRILYDFNDTGTDYPKDKTIHQLFAEQVSMTPDRIAVFGHGQTRTYTDKNYVGADLRVCPFPNACPVNLTYRQLNEQSNHLAGLLIEKGVLPDNIVGIMMERSVEMIIGILGILKSGGAYLPIDPGYPQERIDYMLKDSNIRLLINKSEIRNPKLESPRRGHPIKNITDQNKTQNFGAALVLNLDHLNFEFVLNFDIRASDLNSLNLAYLIYTSGSTGKPKGVPVEHKNVVKLVKGSNFMVWGEREKLLLTGNIGFDITIFEIFGPLLHGAALFLVAQDEILNAEKLKECLYKNEISILHLIPQLFNQLAGLQPGIFAGLSVLLVGGDKVAPHFVNKIKNLYQHLKILHMYGPTENTTFSTFLPVEQDYEYNIPIGTPLANTTAYIVDKYGHLQPVGVMGELWVGGAGVARGYLNKPELTAEKFGPLITLINRIQKTKINKSFAGVKGELFQKLPLDFYKTGDLARRLSDGNIEFLGRIDNQVKIRGCRVELGEIENQLTKCPGIKEAAVLIQAGEDGDKCLCAYIVADNEIKVPGLKKYLSNRLPDYMVPSYFMQIEKIPLTVHGKTDLRALPPPQRGGGEDYIAPGNELENKLAGIWAEVLNIEKDLIGINSSFFELGGHSLNAALLLSRIHKELNVKIPMAEIFKSQKIAGLAQYIKNVNPDQFESIKPVEKKEYYPASSAQKRMFIVNRYKEDDLSDNTPKVFIIESKLDKQRLYETFNALILRHEALRTSFEMIADELTQRIHDHVEFQIHEYRAGKDTKSVSDISTEVEAVARNIIKPFDLSRAPLIRVGLIETTGEKPLYLLVFDMHHIISDGASNAIIVRDFLRIYEGRELPGLNIQYKDFTCWQHARQNIGQIKRQEEYWLGVLGDDLPRLNLPLDYPRPTTQCFDGDSIDLEVEAALYEKITQLAVTKGATLYMVFLAVFNILLSRYSGQEDIIIGSPVAGRPHADLENIVGMFVNMLVMRNHPSAEKTFAAFFDEVKTNTLSAFDHQDYQFDDLVERLHLKRELNRSILFEVVMDIIEMKEEGKAKTQDANNDKDGVRFALYPYKREKTPFDLMLHLVRTDGLTLKLTYCTALFKPTSVQKMASRYIEILTQVVENPDIQLKDIVLSQDLITAGMQEMDQVEFGF